MRKPLLSTAELCEASGAKLTQIDHWRKLGLLVPAECTPGTLRWDAENVLEATQLVELTKALYSGRQLQLLFAIQRADVARQRSPAARLVRRYELYINTVIALADTFGRGPGYDDWLARQRAQLARMKAALKDTPERSDRDLMPLATAACRIAVGIETPLAS